jgi:hypothetical protein
LPFNIGSKQIFDLRVVKILTEGVPVVLGLLIAIWSAVGAVLNYNQLAERHRTAAQKYQTLTRRCKNWKTDFPDESFAAEARAEAKQASFSVKDFVTHLVLQRSLE